MAATRTTFSGRWRRSLTIDCQARSADRRAGTSGFISRRERRCAVLSSPYAAAGHSASARALQHRHADAGFSASLRHSSVMIEARWRFVPSVASTRGARSLARANRRWRRVALIVGLRDHDHPTVVLGRQRDAPRPRSPRRMARRVLEGTWPAAARLSTIRPATRLHDGHLAYGFAAARRDYLPASSPRGRDRI